MISKNNDAYKTISEVAELLNLINPNTGKVSTHTLRFWENEFKQVKPTTMGQALRIDGITPAAVYILLSHVKRKSIKQIA